MWGKQQSELPITEVLVAAKYLLVLIALSVAVTRPHEPTGAEDRGRGTPSDKTVSFRLLMKLPVSRPWKLGAKLNMHAQNSR
jgi:hypothetical protein